MAEPEAGRRAPIGRRPASRFGWVTTGREAAPLERDELVGTGEGQDARLDEPRPRGQPRRRVDDVMEADVAEEGQRARRRAQTSANAARKVATRAGGRATGRRSPPRRPGWSAGWPAASSPRPSPASRPGTSGIGDPQRRAALDQRVVVEERPRRRSPRRRAATTQAPAISAGTAGIAGPRVAAPHRGDGPTRSGRACRRGHGGHLRRSRGCSRTGGSSGRATSRPARTSSSAFAEVVARDAGSAAASRRSDPGSGGAARGRARRRGTCRSAPYALATRWPSSTRYGNA